MIIYRPLRADAAPCSTGALQTLRSIQTIAPTSIPGMLLEKSHFAMFVCQKCCIEIKKGE